MPVTIVSAPGRSCETRTMLEAVPPVAAHSRDGAKRARPRRYAPAMDTVPVPVPVRATPADAAEVLVLQRCCWVGEAITNNDLTIPALRETLEDVRSWMQDAWVLRQDGRLIGAVRASRDGELWRIGRLMVAPDRQGQGLGGVLLRHAESSAPSGVVWHELFTGMASEGNLARYRHAGYVEVSRGDGLVFLRKPVISG